MLVQYSQIGDWDTLLTLIVFRAACLSVRQPLCPNAPFELLLPMAGL